MKGVAVGRAPQACASPRLLAVFVSSFLSREKKTKQKKTPVFRFILRVVAEQREIKRLSA
jgi:hypothetical protein